MTSNAIVTHEASSIMERVLAVGDLAQLTPEERNRYYAETCKSIGLNPMTRPFEYLRLSGKLVLYARRDAADQLRKLHGISLRIAQQQASDGLYMVTVEAKDAKGRTDADIGAVDIGNLRGEARANGILKAITKAKRRVTLSICGLGMLDETEVADIPSGEKQTWEEPAKAHKPAKTNGHHDPETGVVIEPERPTPSASDWPVYFDTGEVHGSASNPKTLLRLVREAQEKSLDKTSCAHRNKALLHWLREKATNPDVIAELDHAIGNADVWTADEASETRAAYDREFPKIPNHVDNVIDGAFEERETEDATA